MEYKLYNNSDNDTVNYFLRNNNDFHLNLPSNIFYYEDKDTVKVGYNYYSKQNLHNCLDHSINTIILNKNTNKTTIEKYFFLNGIKINSVSISSHPSLISNLRSKLFFTKIDKLKKNYDDVHIDLVFQKGQPYLNTIIVPINKRNQGIGTEILKKIIDYCYEYNFTLSLSPLPVSGEKSHKREQLIYFYERLGMVLRGNGDMYMNYDFTKTIENNIILKSIKEIKDNIDNYISNPELITLNNLDNIKTNLLNIDSEVFENTRKIQ